MDVCASARVVQSVQHAGGRRHGTIPVGARRHRVDRVCREVRHGVGWWHERLAHCRRAADVLMGAAVQWYDSYAVILVAACACSRLPQHLRVRRVHAVAPWPGRIQHGRLRLWRWRVPQRHWQWVQRRRCVARDVPRNGERRDRLRAVFLRRLRSGQRVDCATLRRHHLSAHSSLGSLRCAPVPYFLGRRLWRPAMVGLPVCSRR